MINREHQTIKINKKDVAIALKWVGFEYKNAIFKERLTQSKIKKDGFKYGYINFFPEKKYAEIAMSPKVLEGSLIGALLLSQKIKNSIYFAKVGVNEETEEDFYWLCGVEEDGKIIPETDVILTDEQLYDKISEIGTLYENIKYYAPKADLILLEGSEEVNELELKSLLTQETDKTFIITLLEKKRNTKLIAGISIAIALSGYVGYEYIYKEDPLVNEITRGTLSQQLDMFYNQIQRMEPTERSVSSFNQEERNQYAIQQVNNIFEENFYTKEDIINNLRLLSNILPEFLNEWEITPLVYNQNQFTFAYRRIANGTGYFNDLNRAVNKILNNNNLNFQLIGTSEQLTEAVYRVNFESNIEEELIRRQSIEASSASNRIAPAEQMFQEVDQIRNEIRDLENQVNNLGWNDKRWGSELDRIRQTISIRVSQANSILRDIESIYNERQDEINNNRLGELNENSHYDNYKTSYLNKTQLNEQNFIFTQPIEKGFLPEIQETANNRNRNNRFRPFIEILEIGIRSNPFSLGLNSALEAMNIVDNKSILFYNVQYNTKTNEWVIRGNMYEQF